MTDAEFFLSIGHRQERKACGPEWLLFGPAVPKNKIWTLRLLVAKNSMDPSQYPTVRTTADLNVCVLLSPGGWVLLEGDVEVPQFKLVKWEGFLELPAGSRMGAWFRGIEVGDLIELNAIYDIETCKAE